MSASDQDTPAPEAPAKDEPGEPGEAAPKAPGTPKAETGEAAGREAEEEAGEAAGEKAEEEDEAEDEAGEREPGEGLTPRQARRLRVAAASVLLVALGVVLVVRLASRTSVLVVGVYGLAMILCGIVIELSRNGRTRLGTWLLAGGLVAALAADWILP
ncbi:hypothetical protein [Streptomyces termitum]|uniref:hypothetical protein n=1 Tax=Streptomyces termitum TaxID=67368 RepID=UPI0037A44A5B